MLINSRITTNEVMDRIAEEKLDMSNDLYINGQIINGGASAYVKVIDEHTVEMIHMYYLTDDFYEDMDVRIRYATVNTPATQQRNTWVFDFTASGVALAEDTEVISIQAGINLDNGGYIEIKNFTSNALAQRIYYRSEERRVGKEC